MKKRFDQADEAVKKATIDARVASSALGKQAADLRKQAVRMMEYERPRALKRANYLERQARAQIIREVTVVACTCISAGT